MVPVPDQSCYGLRNLLGEGLPSSKTCWRCRSSLASCGSFASCSRLASNILQLVRIGQGQQAVNHVSKVSGALCKRVLCTPLKAQHSGFIKAEMGK